VEIDPEGRYVIARTPWAETYWKDLDPGARIRIVEGVRSCEERVNGGRILRCGTVPKPKRVNPAVVFDEARLPRGETSTAVIELDGDNEESAIMLARSLLDSGSSDMVVLSPQGPDSPTAALEAFVPDTVAASATGIVFKLQQTQSVKTYRIPAGWCGVKGDLRALAAALGQGEPVAPRALWPEAYLYADQCPKVRARAADWQRHLTADRAALEVALQGDYPVRDALAALVYIPDTLVWDEMVPLAWAMVGAQTQDSFQAAIQARLRMIDEVMTGGARDQARSLVAFMGKQPERFQDRGGAERFLQGDALDRFNAVMQDAVRREVGWRRVRLRELAKSLYAANQRVVGDYPFGQSETDASVENASALFRAVRIAASMPDADSGAQGQIFRSADGAAVLGRQQGEWVRNFDELLAVKRQIGTWPIAIRGELTPGAEFRVETGAGGWRAAREWQPGQKIRICAPGALKYEQDANTALYRPVQGQPNCFTAKGDWAFLRMVDRDKPLSKYVRKLTRKVTVGGASQPGFRPKAIDFPKLQDSPGAFMAQPKGDDGCPYTCQLHGWPSGDRVGTHCLCGE
jgi:hypothetical protein